MSSGEKVVETRDSLPPTKRFVGDVVHLIVIGTIQKLHWQNFEPNLEISTIQLVLLNICTR